MGELLAFRASSTTPGAESTVSQAEMAAQLGVTERTLYNWRRQGMPYEPWGLRLIRYYPSRVKAWLRNRRP